MSVVYRFLLLLIVYLSYVSRSLSAEDEDQAFKAGSNAAPDFKEAKAPRYLLYDVNPGEGFNLRRDVYMRVANLVKFLNEDEPWVLVLPPWGRLYHWQSREINQIKVPWSLFFDLPSLKKHVPVIEFEEFMKISGKPTVIDEIYLLQRYKEGWTKWEEKMDIRECIDKHGFTQDEEGKWHNWYFGYEDKVYANKFVCLSYMGHAGFIKDFLVKNLTARSVYLSRAESLIHGKYSEFHPMYWTARRSMVFARHLKDIGDQFRAKYLDSDDKKDQTVIKKDWTKMRKEHGDAVGGPYLAVHLRRKDYTFAHGNEIPSVEGAAKQVKKLLKKLKLSKVFVATDAPEEEFFLFANTFSKKIEVHRFRPTPEQLNKYKDGGIAIIDQWIAAHARYFIGSYVSTFSFRIQDEREIMGFDPKTTFNRLCNDKEETCEQPAHWVIKYE